MAAESGSRLSDRDQWLFDLTSTFFHLRTDTYGVLGVLHKFNSIKFPYPVYDKGYNCNCDTVVVNMTMVDGGIDEEKNRTWMTNPLPTPPPSWWPGCACYWQNNIAENILQEHFPWNVTGLFVTLMNAWMFLVKNAIAQKYSNKCFRQNTTD